MSFASGNIEVTTFERIRPSRVFVLEDQAFLRLGLGAFLKEEPGIEWCGASACDEDILLGLHPDLVLLGTSQIDPGGIEMIAELRSGGFTGKIIVLSHRENVARAEAALRRGANGFLTKDDPPETLSQAIRTVLTGEIYVSDELKSKLVNRVVNGGEESPLDHLTNREHQILELVGAGLKTGEIASRLGISPKTVDVHRGNIKKKLKISTVNELICFAARHFD